ncbi:MAG: thymidine phosphorylase [Pseudomonadota bacterium]
MARKFLSQETIRLKREGEIVSADRIADFVSGITDGSVSEGQVAAFAMAVFFQGMETDERVALTTAMRDSGTVLAWPELDGPVVDKHSTGGVGDNVSLILAPIVAACGAYVPMISGRGLGHTGGTLDKFDSIPGYQTQPDEPLFRKVTKSVGCAIIGQTADLAPADKRFYGIRDVTATVESVPLITASILSKKLAAGLDALVLDVKCGNGAFMKDADEARELATSLVNVANGAGVKTTALLTDMNQPLASAVGNAVEMRNAVRLLTGDSSDTRLEAVTVELCAEMVLSADVAISLEDAREQCLHALSSGAAAEKFGQMVSELGGPSDFMERMDDHLPVAPIVREITAGEAGTVAAINAFGLGVSVIELGGGRRVAADEIDHSVGYSDVVQIGDQFAKGDPLAVVHAADEAAADAAEQALKAAITVGEPADGPLFIERIGG